MKLLILIVLLTGCSYFKRENGPKESMSDRIGELKEKYDQYLYLSKESVEDGWILTDKCDALLHTSLLIAGTGSDFDPLLRARNTDGQWFRRPSMDCLSSGSSKSTISRDMLLGLMIAIEAKGQSEVIADLVDYARKHNYIMGQHDGSLDGQSRVVVNPVFYDLMADLNNSLKISLNKSYSSIYNSTINDFRFTDHLDVLSIYLRGQIDGAISDKELGKLKQLLNEDPNNALVSAVKSKYDDGNQSHAVDVLLREDLFPIDRLPNSSDRCSEYLWMHGENDGDWKPCQGMERHPGHDFIFAAKVILDANNH